MPDKKNKYTHVKEIKASKQIFYTCDYEGCTEHPKWKIQNERYCKQHMLVLYPDFDKMDIRGDTD